MKDYSYHFENYLRPNYEIKAAKCWILSAVLAAIAVQFTSLPKGPLIWMFVIAVIMASARLPKALTLRKFHTSLSGKPLEFLSIKDLDKKLKKIHGNIWLGWGFVWENRHAQRVFEILRRDLSNFVQNDMKKASTSTLGNGWIHGLEPDEEQIVQSLKHTEGHTLIEGTTGAGKTQAFILLISQAILRGEPVLVIDPKGDIDMRQICKDVTDYLGVPERFAYLHPAFPEESVRLDLLKNYSRISQIATRISSLIPTEAGADVFQAFSWQAMNNVLQALDIVFKRPSLKLMKKYLQMGVDELLITSILAFAEDISTDHSNRLTAKLYEEGYKKDVVNKKATRAAALYYQSNLAPIKESSAIESLINMYNHDAVHFSKMVTNLFPILNKLTTGDFGELLSPDYKNLDDKRRILDTQKIIEDKMVFYLGLDSLSDKDTGVSLGSLFLSDIVATAGERYNYVKDMKPVNIFIDEASEIINEPTIMLLNKGRGAKIRLTIATQTIADFEVRLGSAEKARQVLANVNNIIAFRTTDIETQKYVIDNLPSTRVNVISRSQSQSPASEGQLLYKPSIGESLSHEEAPIFMPQLLGNLRDLEFIGKISGMVVKGRMPIVRLNGSKDTKSKNHLQKTGTR